MKDLTPSLQETLQKKTGLEPILLVEVQWKEGGQRYLYSATTFGNARPVLLNVSGLDFAIQLDGAGDSQQVGILLDDTNGELKALLDTVDVHQRPVWVYQSFKELTPAHRIPLFRGQITSPLEWSEGDRTLSFTALTRLDDVEVAFSMEEGDFPVVPEKARGAVWPLVFGEVCHMPVTQVRSPIKGILERGEGMHDFTLPNRITQANYIVCPDVHVGDKLVQRRSMQPPYNIEARWVPEYAPDQRCLANRRNLICELEHLYQQQKAYENDILPIRGGSRFPQGTPVTINIEGARFTGTFSGDDFHITTRQHPLEDSITLIDPKKPRSFALRPTVTPMHEGWTRFSDLTWRSSTVEDCTPGGSRTSLQPTGGPEESRQLYEAMPKGEFVWLPAGSEVFLEDEAEILHIVSLIPGVINQVAAYRRLPAGQSWLMEVPPDYYTIYQTDYLGYEVMEIGLHKKLSQHDSSWDDNLYVSMTSSVGPNPVDVIEWLVTKYTQLEIDTASFTDVRKRLLNYPVNFWVNTRENVLQLLQDIAYQVRCACLIRDDRIYLKYLSEEPTPVKTLTASDLLSQSLQIGHTPTEDIATKHVINWAPAGASIDRDDPKDRQIILKYNVPKYGTRSLQKTYFSQNTFDTILKSATFWLIRRAHTWKMLSFDTALTHLDLELFDCIEVDVPQLSSQPVKCLITQSQIDLENNRLHFEAWTPILAGETEPFPWAWPADKTPTLPWPLPGDEHLADPNPGITVSPPLGHILAGGGELIGAVVSSGDPRPSDLDDVYPEFFCDVAEFEHIAELEPHFDALDRLEESFDNPNSPTTSYNINWPDDPEREREEPEEPEEPEEEEEEREGCTYELRILYVIPSSVTSGRFLGGCRGGPCWCAKPGKVCTHSAMYWKTHIFSSRYAASQFAKGVRALVDAAKHPDACPHECGVEVPYSFPWGDPIRVIPDPNHPDEECEWSGEGDPDHPMADAGETYSPVIG